MENSYVTAPSAFESDAKSIDSNEAQTVLSAQDQNQDLQDLRTVSGVSLEGGHDLAPQCEAPALEQIVAAVRVLTVDAVERAKSGHPGMPLGMAPTGSVLWMKHLRCNPCNPDWVNRDRFILSAGHGSMLQYALLYLFGYDSITIEDIKTFRQLGSRACGHPENTITHGVEVATGPLGQGISNSVGIALAESHLSATYNREDAPLLINHYTYCIAGDGCLMEGVTSEACSLAGHWGLGKLIVFWDDNEISIEGCTDLAFTEDVTRRYESYGWQVIWVEDGNNDIDGIDAAIIAAKKCVDKPTLIRVSTTIGYGAPTKAGTAKIHGSCLGPSEVEGLKKRFGWAESPFEIPDNISAVAGIARSKGERLERDWWGGFDEYRERYPQLGSQFESQVLRKEFPVGWADSLAEMGKLDMEHKPCSTRQLSHAALNSLARHLPHLFGGSADLGPSNLTTITEGGDYQASNRSGRNLHFGVREHGMAAIAVGIALHHGGLIPFCATFFVFTDYCRAAIRTAALSRAGVIFVMTHDSVLLGEDGPTHQPVEHLAAMRAMPGIVTMRPCEAVETATCYDIAIRRRDAPTMLVFSRQKYKCKAGSQLGTRHGAYVFSDGASETAELVRTEDGNRIRVVSMPCMELFKSQAKKYRRSVLPKTVPMHKRLVVEAGCSFGWDEFAGNFHTVDEFGASGNLDDVANLFKLTVRDVAERIRGIIIEDESDAD